MNNRVALTKINFPIPLTQAINLIILIQPYLLELI